MSTTVYFWHTRNENMIIHANLQLIPCISVAKLKKSACELCQSMCHGRCLSGVGHKLPSPLIFSSILETWGWTPQLHVIYPGSTMVWPYSCCSSGGTCYSWWRESWSQQRNWIDFRIIYNCKSWRFYQTVLHLQNHHSQQFIYNSWWEDIQMYSYWQVYTSLVLIEFVRASTCSKQTSLQSLPTTKLMLTNTLTTVSLVVRCAWCHYHVLFLSRKGSHQQNNLNNHLYTCWSSKSCSCASEGAYASAGAYILSMGMILWSANDLFSCLGPLHWKTTWNLAVQQPYQLACKEHAKFVKGEFSFRLGNWKIDFHLRFGLWSCHLQGWCQSGNELQRRVYQAL